MSQGAAVSDAEELAVVLAPGLLCDARLWTGVRTAPPLDAISPDFSEDSTLEAMAARILREAPGRFVLAGFSMGGMAAILAAARAPERIAGLLILSTHGEIDGEARRVSRMAQIARADREPFDRLVAGEIVPAAFTDPAAHARAAALTADMALGQGAGVYRRHVQALIDRPDIGQAAARLRMPVVVMTGAEDRAAPPQQAIKLARTIPGAVLEIVPGCGHMLPLERPDLVSTALRGLISHASLEAALP